MRINCPYCLEKLGLKLDENNRENREKSLYASVDYMRTCANCGCRWKVNAEVELIHLPDDVRTECEVLGDKETLYIMQNKKLMRQIRKARKAQ